MRVNKKAILEELEALYPDAKPELHFSSPYETLVATILSAQCTDQRVNMVTPAVFRDFPTPQAMAATTPEILFPYVKSCGFKSKAQNIVMACRIICEKHGGEVPHTMEELTALPGVGRKTANVIRGNIYGIPSIVVDTHVKRISRKLGLTDTDDPEKAEYELMAILPKDHWVLWNIDIITLGRTICIARRERCDECFLAGECPSCKKSLA